MRFRIISLCLATLLLVPVSCRREEKRAGESITSARRFPLKGIIREVDGARAQVTVDHEDVPGYMSAMTMPFPVKDDPRIVQILRPGDRVEATLVVQGDRYWLENVLTKGFVATPAAATAQGSKPAIIPRPNRAVGVGDTVPDFTLTDQSGTPVTLSRMRGEPVAVTFLYTRCPVATACPMTTAKFSRLAAMLGPKPFARLLVITVDPEHDTVDVLADYAKKAGADTKNWKFLTGPPDAVAEVASRFGVLYYPDRSSAQIVHGQAVAVVDPSGRLSSIYYGETWEPEHILRDLQKAKSAA